MVTDASATVGDAQQQTERHRQELDGMTQRFCALAAALPQVQLVLLDGHARLWTVISAPPFEDHYRYAVYDAQRVALGPAEDLAVDFRLINQEELTEDLASVLPPAASVLYKRSSAV